MPSSRKFFEVTNWAYFLDPGAFFKGHQARPKHFLQQFSTYQQLPALVEGFMDIVMRHVEMPGDILSALEWSVNEICDNVINHSASGAGGFLQVIAYPTNDIIAFTVADAGRGILNSLREGIPDLETDLQAIEEAIKAGVTRTKEHGQGNGLAGTHRITTMTGGSLDILSGTGRMIITLAFGPTPYTPYTVVDSKYELPDEDALLVKMKEQPTGTGSRAAGNEMHIKLLNLMAVKPAYPIYLNWQNITVIASSFADEFIGKLYIRLGKVKFEQIIRNVEIVPLVAQLIEKAIAQRTEDQRNDC